MKKLILLSALLLLVLFTNAQIVNIPDTNFKAALIAHNPVIDTNSDGEIQVSEASSFTGMIYINNPIISDLTGIEAFISLTQLYCNFTQIISLDLSNNTALSVLNCEFNHLTTLDVSNCTALTNLVCYDNQISSLDLSNCTVLTNLECCVNQLTTLDVSNSTAFTALQCCNNQLTSLNVKNGNNTNFTYFHAPGNPNLFCIEVDNAVWSTANWTDIDTVASFSEDCSLSVPNELQIAELKVFPNPTIGKISVQVEGVVGIEVMDITGKNLQGFENLEGLDVDLSHQPKGIYIIKVTTNNGVAVEKVILE